jgi:hypothetical protein
MRNTVGVMVFWVLLLGLAILTLCDPVFAWDGTIGNTELDRIAYAVDGVESSHGKNPSMWRAKPEGPQGPMQVGEKAALDVGGGDRFDIDQNRAMGRAYLALLYQRYGNWPDAISAYNWGMGNLDNWIKSGRQSEKLVSQVALYLRRVLGNSGMCGSATSPTRDCRMQMALDYMGFRLRGQPIPTIRAQWYDRLLPGLEQSGRPLPILAASGRPLPATAQSGRLVRGLEQSGRTLSRSERRPVCYSLGDASTQPRTQGTISRYSIFAPACH